MRLNPSARTRIVFARDSAVEFVSVRIVGDTIYGWQNAASRLAGDSVAIPLTRVQSVEQSRIDYWLTVRDVVLSTGIAVALGFIAIVVLLHTDHS